MSSYKDVLGMIREGKSVLEIQATMKVQPVVMRRLLGSKRLRKALEMDRELGEKVAANRLAMAMDHLLERCIQIADGDESETARKAAIGLMEQAAKRAKAALPAASAEMDREQKLKFLASLLPSQQVSVNMILRDVHTGEYGFEEFLRTKERPDWMLDRPDEENENDDEAQEGENKAENDGGNGSGGKERGFFDR